jgi:hypothetical protein
MAELTNYYKLKGFSLLNVLEEISTKFGYYLSDSIYFFFKTNEEKSNFLSFFRNLKLINFPYAKFNNCEIHQFSENIEDDLIKFNFEDLS